ncbi:MAG: hypothetical protein H6600_09075, partial [Flavobacteriales bacterium]|nr:hypothetical protein [Flavobacteriales bacterium]
LKDLIYNKVIAFDFYGTHERYCIFDKARFSSDNYRNNAYEMKILNQDQVNLISNLITNPMTYGQSTAACFDPSMAFIFFDETKIVLEVDICLDCNFLVINSPEEFSLEVDYQKFEEYEDSETGESYRYYLVGFSEEGISGIVSLAKELKMNYSDYKKHNE